MKKIFIFTLLLLALGLSACSLRPNGPAEELNIVGNDRDEHGCISSAGYSWCEAKQKCLRTWEEKCEPETLGVNSSISSEELGLKVSYYSNPENKTSAKAEGQRIYFYMDGPITVSDYKTGQYLEGFTKAPDTSLSSAIESQFLKNISREACFVTITEETETYQKAIIDYPDTPCLNGSPAFTCHPCPANYSKSNGIAYFMYYKDQPDKYFYFNIGQYSLLMGSSGASSSLEWFNNLEFIK